MNLTTKGWNEGEVRMHQVMHVPEQGYPTRPGLSFHAQRLLHMSSLLALGVVDEQGRPWTTLIGGEAGFARSLGQSIVGVKALADVQQDPVLQTILQHSRNKNNQGDDARTDFQEFSALGIHLATRDRVKIQGQLLGAGVVSTHENISEVQIAFAVKGSLGNCPKYLNKKDLVLTTPEPVLLSDTIPLSEPALALLSQADLFFITSHQPDSMSTNHRGGSPGLIRVLQNDQDGCILVYPEYSGNRFYQTLGNLIIDPRAGLAIPDFETGNILYLTCTTKVLYGESAASTLPRSNLAVQLLVTAVKHVQHGLAFRASAGEPSPYNPPVRYLPSERPPGPQSEPSKVYATLLSREPLTSTIARLKFRTSKPITWSAGQYVALSFESELDDGYAHMNDDDPRALNDDYVRTFTVSSPPSDSKLGSQEFEITFRNVGKVTDFLFKLNIRAGLEVPMLGFAGDFAMKQGDETDKLVPFIAGGIGITPLLSQMESLDLRRLKLFWTISARDLGLVMNTLRMHPGLAKESIIFVTGYEEQWANDVVEVETTGVTVLKRRLQQSDLTDQKELGNTWYLCTGPALRKSVLTWLGEKQVIYEDFDY